MGPPGDSSCTGVPTPADWSFLLMLGITGGRQIIGVHHSFFCKEFSDPGAVSCRRVLGKVRPAFGQVKTLRSKELTPPPMATEPLRQY